MAGGLRSLGEKRIYSFLEGAHTKVQLLEHVLHAVLLGLDSRHVLGELVLSGLERSGRLR